MEIVSVLGIAYGLFLLVLPWLLWGLCRRVRRLTTRLEQLEHRQQRLAEALLSSGETDVVLDTPQPPPQSAPAFEAVQTATAAEPETPPVAAQRSQSESAARPEANQQTPSTGFGLFERLKTWAVGGNTVARIGVLVLFFGVAFLLKYTVERGLLPIALRLAGVALGGFGLLLLGWYLRQAQHHYALILQGGGVGMVYLTVFTAVTRYQMLPVGLGHGLLIVLVGLASALAIRQDARSLAVLGVTGGFLAPVLITRSGSHVTLFAYYAILDAGILAVAWFKAWRELNLVGFLFTFVIGGLWGAQYYRPEYFASTEPFLIAFVVFYVAVAVLFAHRQPPHLRGYVDGALVFGVPLVAFGLQSALVHGFAYGMALSALGAGLLYGLLAMLLWHRRVETLRMLTEAFLALSVAFGTLAIPLAVDGRWTGSAWALEGAALVWVGMRQHRPLAGAFGVLLQLGAGVALLIEFDTPLTSVPVLNSWYLSGLLLSIAGLLSSFLLSRSQQVFPQDGLDTKMSALLLIWGVAWWFGSGLHEIRRQVSGDDWLTVGLGFVAVSCAVLGWLAWRANWPQLRYAPLGLLPVMLILMLVVFADNLRAHPFERWGWAAWLTALASQYGLLWRLERDWPPTVIRYSHLGTLWLAAFLVTWEVAWVIGQLLPGAVVWEYSAWGLLPALIALALPGLGAQLVWPVSQFSEAYLGVGRGVLIGWAGLWSVVASGQSGEPQPLPYIPLGNPLELVQLLALFAMLRWARQTPETRMAGVRWNGLGAVAFVVLNGIVARTMHFWGGVAFDLVALLRSSQFQTALAITWTVLALSCMVAATRCSNRHVWFVGAGLLGVVVAKLFLVDLARVETVARIVSFLVVGVLTLLIGYLAPLPPRVEREPT